jgi:hypothetical protein
MGPSQYWSRFSMGERAIFWWTWKCHLIFTAPHIDPTQTEEVGRSVGANQVVTCHWRLAGTLAATGRQSAARYWGSSSEKKGTMAKSVRAPPLAPVHPSTSKNRVPNTPWVLMQVKRGFFWLLRLTRHRQQQKSSGSVRRAKSAIAVELGVAPHKFERVVFLWIFLESATPAQVT